MNALWLTFYKSTRLQYARIHVQSPIVYQGDSAFANDLHKLMPKYFLLRSGANHYLSMAHNTLRDDLQTKQVKLKRYFYALRPALACLWIVEKLSEPPMEFEHLRVMITDNDVQNPIDELLERKKVSVEKEVIALVPLLNQWLSDIPSYDL